MINAHWIFKSIDVTETESRTVAARGGRGDWELLFNGTEFQSGKVNRVLWLDGGGRWTTANECT